MLQSKFHEKALLYSTKRLVKSFTSNRYFLKLNVEKPLARNLAVNCHIIVKPSL